MNVHSWQAFPSHIPRISMRNPPARSNARHARPPEEAVKPMARVVDEVSGHMPSRKGGRRSKRRLNRSARGARRLNEVRYCRSIIVSVGEEP